MMNDQKYEFKIWQNKIKGRVWKSGHFKDFLRLAASETPPSGGYDISNKWQI